MENKNNQKEQWESLVLLLKEISKENGITQREIAEKTGFKQSHINRVFSLRYVPTLDTFLKICRALDLDVVIEEKE